MGKLSEYCKTQPMEDLEIIVCKERLEKPLSMKDVVRMFLVDKIEYLSDEELGKYVRKEYGRK